MTKDIILTIAGLHATDGDSGEPVEIVTPGQYYLKNGKHYVLFEELLEGVDGKIKSTLKFEENKVELIRTGAATARMIFEKEREHFMFYRTPMGPLEISIYTDDIFMETGEQKMNVQIDYSIKAGEEVVTESTVRINICEKEIKTFGD